MTTQEEFYLCKIVIDTFKKRLHFEDIFSPWAPVKTFICSTMLDYKKDIYDTPNFSKFIENLYYFGLTKNELKANNYKEDGFKFRNLGSGQPNTLITRYNQKKLELLKQYQDHLVIRINMYKTNCHD